MITADLINPDTIYLREQEKSVSIISFKGACFNAHAQI